MSLSTHVLDTAQGCPAEGIVVKLIDSDGRLLFSGKTDQDGRCRDMPPVGQGRYTLLFLVAAYFRDRGVALPDPPFIDIVHIDFGIADAGHYHVPLLVSPYSYSTYRGS